MARQSRRRAAKEEEDHSEDVEDDEEEHSQEAPKSLYEWSAADVGEWLDTALAGHEECELSQATHLLRESISMSKKDRVRYVDQLELHQITGAVVAQGLSVKDLNAIGVQKVGHVRLIYALLIELTQIDFTQAANEGSAVEEIDAHTNIPRLLLEQFTPIPEGTLNSLKLLGAKRIKEGEKAEKKTTPVAPPSVTAVSQPKLAAVPGSNGLQGKRESVARLQPAPLHLESHVQAKANAKGRGVEEPPVVSLAKLLAAGAYLFFATFCTAFTMILVHDRVPDQGKWPPLPDIVLDNVPLIPWAFAVAECILLVLAIILAIILLLHRHRMIVLKRILVIVATAFVMRCVTMYVTSLAVPGDHLECDALHLGPSVEAKLHRAWEITSGMGMSISGVRTCGDYMFSGHTVMLTVLNYSIVEYGANFIDELRIVSWVLNMFGMFFVLAGHEHYTLDVIVAYYVASRMFLYYHDAAETDAKNSRGLFPMFSYFEEYSGGQKLPNKYEAPWRPLLRLAKDFKTLYKAMPAKQGREQESASAKEREA